MTDAGLILEGGAVRGVFTAGVLDYLMEQDIYLKYVVGVSAGSCNAVDYVSKQIGRTKECFISSDKANRFLSVGNILRGKNLYDMDKVFVEFPAEIYPFDFKAYFASSIECEIVVTNCQSGEAEYLQSHGERATLMSLCRASSSLPLVSPIVKVNGVPYLDGGLADSVPLKRSIKKGNRKNVVILTRGRGYRKEPSSRMNRLYERKYAGYPELVKTIKYRYKGYNETMEYIEGLEQKGEIFVVRPEIKCLSRLETNIDKLTEFYNNGYEVMKREKENLITYLNK